MYLHKSFYLGSTNGKLIRLEDSFPVGFTVQSVMVNGKYADILIPFLSNDSCGFFNVETAS